MIEQSEAKTVQALFQLYVALGCLNAVMRKAKDTGLRSKRHHFKSGRKQGGIAFSQGKIIAGECNPEPDKTLIRALAHAHEWTTALRTGKSLIYIAAKTHHFDSYVRTRAQLAFLSPDIQRAILEGRQPPELTLEQIIRKPIPLDWDMQARIYGFRTFQGTP